MLLGVLALRTGRRIEWEAANLKAKGVKSEKLSDGKEKIKLGNKEYVTKWT